MSVYLLDDDIVLKYKEQHAHSEHFVWQGGYAHCFSRQAKKKKK